VVNQTIHVTEPLNKDVLHRFVIPNLQQTIPKLARAMVQLLGMAEQLALTESGEGVPKFQLTQDLSFLLTGEKILVNALVNMDTYLEMICGWCLPWTIQ
jgi:hypothetical protein